MKEMTRVEQFERIRRDHHDKAMSIRQLAEKHRVHRRTVRQALASPIPPPRKIAARPAPVLGPYENLVRCWLRADLDVRPKQLSTTRE